MFFSVVRRLASVHHGQAMTAFEVRASGSTFESSGHADAVRVLIVGSGITTGWGVQTHGLALMGSLRRALQSRLERPVDIEQVSAMGSTMAEGPDVLGTRATEGWDAIVVAFGLSDAMRLTRPARWVQGVDRLLTKLDGDLPGGGLVPIAVAGIPPTDLLGALRTLLPLRHLIARHAVRLNDLTAQTVALHERAVFVPLPGMANSSDRPSGSPEAYALWAEVIADRFAGRIAGTSPAARTAELNAR